MTRLIPLAVMEALLKESGAPRVSEDAKAALKEILENEAKKIGKEAVKLSLHAGRRTVLGQDVRLAKERT